MLPKILDDDMKNQILETRKSGNLGELLNSLPIWMVEKASKKRKMSEDDRSELLLTILEKKEEMWELSLKYDPNFVLGFFVTYAFNLFRNANRKILKEENNVDYLELWQDKKNHTDIICLWETRDMESLNTQLESLPPIVGLALALRFDLPVLGFQKKVLEWRLLEMSKKFDDFQMIYDKKKDSHLKKIELYSARVLRYTRLLLECPENEKRSWYQKKKKEWAELLDKARNKCFFSEREISQILGLSRKEIRNLISKGSRLLYLSRKELLRSA